jgi:hypothetical protein
MKAEKIDLKYTIKNNFTAEIELVSEDQSDEDKTIVQIQVLKNTAEEGVFILDFKRIEGNFFEFHACYKQFYA